MSEENQIPHDPSEETDQNETQVNDAHDDQELSQEMTLLSETEPVTYHHKRIGFSTFILSSVAMILATLMITYTACSGFYRKKLAEAEASVVVDGKFDDAATDVRSALNLFAALFEVFSVNNVEVDQEKVVESALKAFVAQTGDRYAAYYTEKEFEAMQEESSGKAQGIGVNIIESTIMLGGTETKVVKIINVSKDSPAAVAGVKNGDCIVYVGIGESRESVAQLGYDLAVTKLQGEKGTVAEFTVYRSNSDGGYTPLEFSIERKEFTNHSVYYHVSTVEGYGDVGIVKIMQFDLTTPTQFKDAMEDLIGQGCKRFVFDVRYNPGGDLKSIKAVLSYFLKENDVILSTKDKSEKVEITKVQPVLYPASDEYHGCSVNKEDIGRYRDRGFSFAVLCDESTASAAELFTAVFRDYDLATIVGTKTYGKGSMQSIYSLAVFGCPGALKLTTRMYYPPCGESYEGIGIQPDVEIALSEEASKINIYDIPDVKDNQLMEALKHLQ